MKSFLVEDVGVDSGTIMICDATLYSDRGGSIDPSLSKIIKLPPGTYNVSWKIKNTWNGSISGEGIVNNQSGEIAVSDPCYCMPHNRWSKFLDETDCLENPPAGTIVIDEMGGDGEYKVRLIFNKLRILKNDKII